MNQINQGIASDASPALPVKRKRGRPRKDQSLNRVVTVPMPPGFEGVSRKQLHQADAVDEPSDPFVGQAVTGVVEATFDAGYLLTVRIGNSNTNVRGVVFKPGHYIPVTPENDVAPNVKMIRRNEIHLPTVNRMQARGTNQVHGPASQTPKLPASKGKYASPLAAVPSILPVGVRSPTVPFVSQPLSPSNGLSPASQLPSAALQDILATESRGEDVQTVTPLAAVLPVDGYTSTNQLPLPPLQPEDTQQEMQTIVQNENGQGTLEIQQGKNVKETKLTGIMPIEIFQDESESLVTHAESKNAPCKSSAENCGVVSENQTIDMKGPDTVDPSLAAASDLQNQTAIKSEPLGLENKSSGRMTELLQALQENMTENHVPQGEL